MKRLFWSSSLAAIGAALTVPSGASASVIGVTIADASSGNYTLTSVSVTRGAAGTFTYVPGQLTGVDLTDVDAFQTPLLVQRNASLPAPGTRATLIEDGRLDTGVVNITTTNGTPDRSVEVTFASPVVNSAGEDILLFDINGDDGVRFWINDDRTNQGFTLTTANYSADLLTGMPYTSYNYANGSDQDINDLAELESPTGFGTPTNASASINALGLDLSSVGVPLGGSVTSIRFQSVAGAGGRVDPVLVAGLPAVVPEPATAVLLALTASGATLGRRRRRRRRSPSAALELARQE
jgi:hypothetical protein